jgi:GPN-loop GTPase
MFSRDSKLDYISLQDKESVGNLVKLIDKTNGYIFAGMIASAVEFSKLAMGASDWDYYRYLLFFFSCNYSD